MKILTAEDDGTARLILTQTLRNLGHEVTAAADGLQAWELFQKEYFPVLITDWEMPNLDGEILTTMVRAKPHEQYTYVIVLTAHGSKEQYLANIRAGADDFLVKPLDADYLAACLLVAQRLVGVQNHVQRLEKYMAVCSYCKNVRADDSQWVGMEKYFQAKTGTLPSHTICPTCYADHVLPELKRLGIPTSDG